VMPRSQTRDNAKKKRKFAKARRERELEAEKRAREHRAPRTTPKTREKRA